MNRVAFGCITALMLIGALIPGCARSDVSDREVACSSNAGHFICVGERVQYLVSEAPEPSDRVNLVVADPGGPGYDVVNEGESIFEALRVLWPSARIVIPIEPWQWQETTADCSRELSTYMESIRRGEGDVSLPESSCISAAWSAESLSSAYTTIIERESGGGEVLLVGLSFGALRTLQVVDEMAATEVSSMSVVLDSPPAFHSTASAAEFFTHRRSRIASLLPDTTDTPYTGWTDWIESATPTNTTSEDRSTFFSAYDPSAALLLLTQDVHGNAAFLTDVIHNEVTVLTASSFDPALARAADNFFRRLSDDQYDESWAGYFGEICPLYRDWPASEEAGSDPVLRLLYQIHQICGQELVRRPLGEPSMSDDIELCVIERRVDPTGPLGDVDWVVADGIERVTLAGGHRPLTGLFSKGVVDVYEAHRICDLAH